MSMIWLAGTRESEQPIHRYFGACCCDNCSKKCSSCARTRSDQARFLSSSAVRFVMRCSPYKIKIKRLNHGEHGEHGEKRKNKCLPLCPALLGLSPCSPCSPWFN